MNAPAAPLPTRHCKIAIIGTGFSGLGMAIRLKQQGENDFLLFEKESGVRGTWRVNHYPGCACDVQSHLYSFSFEPNPNWNKMFGTASRNRASRSHGSSFRKRSATSKVAPPQHSSEKSCGSIRA